MARQKAKIHVPLLESFDQAPKHLPSPQDRLQAGQLLEELITRENTLAVRFARARKPQAATMSKELEMTRARIANIRFFLASIRLLPIELLSYILQTAFNAGQSPWTFAHVSQSFRDVTFNTPLMWNQILLRTGPTPSRNQNGVETCRNATHLVHALQRSKKVLVTLTIELRPPNSENRIPSILYRSIPYHLGPAANRIRSLTIVDVLEGLEILPPKLITHGLQELQFLHISGTTTPRACYEALLALVDKTALQLHTMRLLISPTFITPNRAFWKRLSNLEMQGLPPLAVLAQCLSLRSLQLRTHSTVRSTTEPIHSPPVVLTNLEQFSAEFFPVTLLRSLSLPSLHTLELDSTHHSIATEVFPPFPSLSSLQLKGRFTVDPSCFIAPSLTHLALLGVRLGGSTLSTPRHYQEWHSPSKLTRLTLENLDDETNAVLAMLRHHAETTYLSMIFVTSTPFTIRSLWSTVRSSSGENDATVPVCPSLRKLRLKYRSDRYKQVAILGMLQALVMVRESAEIPLERITFIQFRHGTAMSREVLPLSSEPQDTGSDSDQSTCDACHGYHG